MIFGSLRKRWQQWWNARHPRSDTLLLTQRNVYILPTRAGWMFAATLLVLLLASINYQLSLGFVLTFLLAGSGIVSMHVTHATLRGLALHLRPVPAVHAQDAAAIEVVLASESTRPRYGVGLRLRDAAPPHWIWVDIAAGGQSTAHLSFVAPQRGRLALPSIVLETRFPLGLFRAWAEWRPASTLLAWPRAEAPAATLPPAGVLGGEAASVPSRGGDEFDGVRAYRRGDPLKLVVWKKVARSGGTELISRDTRASQRSELWLDWAATGTLAPEDRLSRLTGWLLAAERAGLAWGLRLPGAELTPAAGEGQRRAGLELLALWRA